MSSDPAAQETAVRLSRRADDLRLTMHDIAERSGVDWVVVHNLLHAGAHHPPWDPADLEAVSVAMDWPPDALRTMLDGGPAPHPATESLKALGTAAAASGISVPADLTEEDLRQVQGYIDAIAEARRSQRESH